MTSVGATCRIGPQTPHFRRSRTRAQPRSTMNGLSLYDVDLSGTAFQALLHNNASLYSSLALTDSLFRDPILGDAAIDEMDFAIIDQLLQAMPSPALHAAPVPPFACAPAQPTEHAPVFFPAPEPVPQTFTMPSAVPVDRFFMQTPSSRNTSAPRFDAPTSSDAWASDSDSSSERDHSYSPCAETNSSDDSSPNSPEPAHEDSSSEGTPSKGVSPKVRARSRTKKQPTPEDYTSYEEYLEDWAHWRALRDSNNMSVKRSRANKKTGGRMKARKSLPLRASGTAKMLEIRAAALLRATRERMQQTA
eukprot:m.219591 g.219591  ORF g.219591 m.219591 type:complete len:305 (+) comp10197_c0_seq1:466-1380(+)